MEGWRKGRRHHRACWAWWKQWRLPASLWPDKSGGVTDSLYLPPIPTIPPRANPTCCTFWTLHLNTDAPSLAATRDRTCCAKTARGNSERTRTDNIIRTDAEQRAYHGRNRRVRRLRHRTLHRQTSRTVFVLCAAAGKLAWRTPYAPRRAAVATRLALRAHLSDSHHAQYITLREN